MSSIYEALLKAQQKSPQLGKGIENRGRSEDGESFLTELESLYSIATKSAMPKPEVPTFAPVPSPVEIPERSTDLPRQIVISEAPESPEGITSLNGFRRLILPHHEESRLVFRAHSHGLAADQFRLLRHTLRQEFDTGAVLMITSPGVGDGKTFTSLNLSACLAESGDPTLLVEVDVRRATIGELLGCAIEAPGIEDAFAGKVEPGMAVNFIGELSFHVAMVTKVSDRLHLMNGAGVARFLAWAREHFRWVVLDAAPVLAGTDFAEMLPFASAVLLVIRTQSTPRELTKRAVEALGKRLHGVIINEATIHSNL